MSIYDYIVESTSLYESESLNEDKMVKYDGELAPKFGWCVIYVGGPASGKGTATSYLSRIEGDHFNVDDLKEISRMWEIIDPETGRPHSDNFETPSKIIPKYDKDGEPVLYKSGIKKGQQVYYDKYRNMGNPDFVSEVHYEMKPLGKKWQKSILNNPENKVGRERLPNVIFDITGDEISKIMNIVNTMKKIGYKIAILWMLTTPEKAYRNNQLRSRTVDTDTVLIPKHRDVINAIETLFSSGAIEKIDEFWVIDTAIEVNPKEDPIGYHNAQNVYHIPTTKDGLNTFEHIANRIKYNKAELDRMEQKRKLK